MPSLSVTVAIALGLVGLALLLVFIHRITQIIKVENIVARISRETSSSIDTLYPEPFGEPVDRSGRELLASWEEGGDPACVFPRRPGYVRAVVLDALAENGLPEGARLHVAVRPGEQVTRGSALLRLWPADALDDDLGKRLASAVVVESERDVAQDAAFGLRQLADVALRALSPGVNDPTTAVTCIGYLRDALEQLASRRFPEEVRRAGGATIVVDAASFGELVRDSLVEVGWFAAANTRVSLALLDALEAIAASAAAAGARERLPPIREVADEVAACALARARTEADRLSVETRLERYAGSGRTRA